MTAEDFRDFFEVGIGMLLYIFDELFGNNFLVNWTTNFHFNVSGCSVSFSPANDCTDIYFKTAAACANVSPSSVYLIALNLKSLSYAIQKLYEIFSYVSRQLAISLLCFYKAVSYTMITAFIINPPIKSTI